MTRTKSYASGFLALSAATALALAPATGAVADPGRGAPASTDKPAPASVRLAAGTSAAADYWTADRMKNAIPGDVLAARAQERQTASTVPTLESAPLAVKDKPAKGKPAKIKGSQAKSQAASAVSHIGKVFFTLGGADYVCSGNAVTSDNESTVATAGHCAYGGAEKALDFTFVPGYENGIAPYGKWTAKALYAPTQWTSSGNMAYDTAFAVMNQLDGKNLTEVVGSSGVAFGEDRGADYTMYGYPAAKPFTGETLKSCAGTAVPDGINPGFRTQGVPCEMNGGSSGGPWFIGSGPDGYQNSINSYGYSG
ncbi:MAG: trypsin-like serine peptidase, partial [Actinomycetes bacterium]